jgi:hypothetical protein
VFGSSNPAWCEAPEIDVDEVAYEIGKAPLKHF